MKIKALFSLALVTLSSTVFAGLDAGNDDGTVNGGEMILAMWDDRQGKSILFDTGITFRQIVDSTRSSGSGFTVNLATIDPTYKSFFNNDFSTVRWNAYAGSSWSNGYQFDDITYFGIVNTARDKDTLLYPIGGYDLWFFQNVASYIYDASERFASPVDTSATSINRSYRINDVNSPAYLGNLSNNWGDSMRGFTTSTSAKTDEFIALIFYGLADTTYSDGTTKYLGRVKLNLDTSTFGFVPLPAGSWLLVSGLLGFSAIARRKKLLKNT